MSGGVRALAGPLAISVCLLASPIAGAATTVGAMSPGPPPTAVCSADQSWLQYTEDVTTVPTWVVSSGGVITSWSTFTRSGAGQSARFRVYRVSADPAYLVVGHSDLQPLTASAANSFATRIAVQPGDLLGIRTGASGGPCVYPGVGSDAVRFGTFASATVSPGSVETLPTIGSLGDTRINVQAQLEPDGDGDAFGDETQDLCLGLAGPESGCPDNDFTIGKATTTKKGTVRLPLTVPGAGTVRAEDLLASASGAVAAAKKQPRVRVASGTLGAAGVLTLTLKASGTGKKTLNKKGKLKASVRVSFTPSGFTVKSQTTSVRFKKKRKT